MAGYKSGSLGEKKLGCFGTFLSLMFASVCAGVMQATMHATGEGTFLIVVTLVGLAGVFTGWSGAVATLAACVVFFIGIAPSPWLSAALILALILSRLQKYYATHAPAPVTTLNLGRGTLPPKNTKRRQLASAIFKGLKETTIGVAIALTLLVIVNSVIRGLDPDQLDLHRVEAGLLYLQIGLGEITKSVFVVPALILSIAVSAVWPTVKPVSHVLQGLGWIERVALPLTIISTFTLYTSAAHAAYQGIWALAHRDEIVESVEAIKLWRQGAVAAARAEARFQQMPEQEQTEFSQRYQTLVATRAATSEASRLGALIGRGSAHLDNYAVQPELPASPDTESAFRKTKLWSENPESAEPPTKKEVAFCKAEARRANAVYEQARQALITIIQRQLKIPVTDVYLDQFVDSLVGETVKTSMEFIVPEGIPRSGGGSQMVEPVSGEGRTCPGRSLGLDGALEGKSRRFRRSRCGYHSRHSPCRENSLCSGSIQAQIFGSNSGGGGSLAIWEPLSRGRRGRRPQRRTRTTEGNRTTAGT